MKVLLISPPVTLHKSDLSLPIKPTLLGLCYIGAILKKSGHEVKILDCFSYSACQAHTDSILTRYGISDKEILEKISSFNPDVVGVTSMFTSCFKDAHNVARIAKEFNRDILVVFGGTHTSTLPQMVMRDNNVDLAVIGEGEVTICEVLNKAMGKKDFSQIRGIARREHGKLKLEEPRVPVQNLDDLPFPARDLLEDNLEIINKEHSKNKYIMRSPIGYVQTSRGCPFDCYFCSFILAFGKKWRARSAKNVVDEIECLLNRYGYREIHFVDDNCSISRSRMNEICDEIIKRKMNIKIATPSGIAINTLDAELLKKMKKAGFYRLCFGIETGDHESQKLISKRVDLDRARTVISEANKLGFWTAGTFIIGHTHETIKEIKATIDFAKGSNLDFAVFAILVPQFGTRAYDILKQQGLTELDVSCTDPNSDDWYKVGPAYYRGGRTVFFSNEQLQKIRSGAYREFIIHKLFTFKSYINLARKINSAEDIKYLLRLSSVPVKMLLNILMEKTATYIPLRKA